MYVFVKKVSSCLLQARFLSFFSGKRGKGVTPGPVHTLKEVKLKRIKMKERNEERELTIALAAAMIFFLALWAVSAWILPSMGVRT